MKERKEIVKNKENKVLFLVFIWRVAVITSMGMALRRLREKLHLSVEGCGGEAGVEQGQNMREIRSEKLRTVPMQKSCKVKVRIGKVGRFADGQRHCPHCGKTRGSCHYPSVSDSLRDLGTAKCGTTRRIIAVVVPDKRKTGEIISPEVSNPDNKCVVRIEGTDVNKLKCPQCSKQFSCAHRYEHTVLCY